MNLRHFVLTVASLSFLPAVFAIGCGSGSGASVGNDGDVDSGKSSANDSGGGGFEDSGEHPSDAGNGNKDSGAKGDAGLTDSKPWPDCNTQPAGVPTKTISEIWSDDPTTATAAWVHGATVSAVSFGGCSAGHACQIFLQTDATYATVADGAHKALKLYVTSTVSAHFSTVMVGDTVDVYGWAIRNTMNGQNELELQVTSDLEGCAKKTGSLALVPVKASLSDFTVQNYETTIGPLLVELDNLHGTTTGSFGETFGVFPGVDAGFVDAGSEIVSLSPFFLPNGTFAAPMQTNHFTSFSKLVGILGLYVPNPDGGTPATYDEIYPRTMADITLQ
ncbi:MAG: hypothetical protein ABI551_20860 [Polyangiaceae bacterium]